jgi:diacylglycerol kinase
MKYKRLSIWRILRRTYNSTKCSLNGLRVAYTHDTSFRLEVKGFIVVLVIIVFLWPLTMVEWFMVMSSYILVLVTVTGQYFN